MRSEFVQLDRTFVKYDPGQDQEAIAVQSYVRGSLGLPSNWSWDKVLEYPRVVILGEAGSGKTWEMEAQADRLNAGGKPAFFIRLENLAGSELSAILGGDDLNRFREWQKSAAEASFFLDAVDESRLGSFHAFEQALANFSRSLGPAHNRARIVISSRVTEWRGGTDEALVNQHLPPPRGLDGETVEIGSPELQTAGASPKTASGRRKQNDDDDDTDKTPPVLVAMIAPLSRDQVGKLAMARTSDPEAFLAAIDTRDAWDFARRPLDGEDLLAYWVEHGDLGALSELQEFSIGRKLAEPNVRRAQDDPLAPGRARAGAENLAAAVILSRRLTFFHPEAGRVDHPSLDPKEILAGWKPGEVKALFTRPLFDGAAYGKIRFHHRRTTEYLAACWFRRLVEASLPLVDLHGHFFRESHALRVVPPSLAPVTAWLAAWFTGPPPAATATCPRLPRGRRTCRSRRLPTRRPNSRRPSGAAPRA